MGSTLSTEANGPAPPPKRHRADALAALKCGDNDDLVQKYDELLETFDAEQNRFLSRLRGLERAHETTMASLSEERDTLQRQLAAKQTTFDERLEELEVKLTSLLKRRIEEKRARECAEADDDLQRVLAKIARLESDLNSLQAQRTHLVERMADNDAQHEADVLQAVEEATREQASLSEMELTKLRTTIDAELAALTKRRDELLALLARDEATYTRELEESRASFAGVLRALEAELRLSLETAQKDASAQGDHASVVKAKRRLLEEAQKMKLERDAADERLRELEEKARLAKLRLEQTRTRHADADAALTQRLDKRDEEFRASCVDDPAVEVAHERELKSRAKAASEEETGVQRGRLDALRAKLEAIKRAKQSEVDALRAQVKQAEADALNNEAEAEGAVQKRGRAYRHELTTATTMAEREEQKAMRSVGDTSHQEAFSTSMHAGELDGRVATLRSDACALKAAVAELERTLKAESSAHGARSKALQNALKRADASLIKMRTGATSTQLGLGTFDAETKDEWASLITKGRSLVGSWVHDGGDEPLVAQDALGRRSSTVAQSLSVVKDELGRASGDRFAKLKAKHGDLEREASILERLRTATGTTTTTEVVANTRLEALKLARAIEAKTQASIEAMRSVSIDEDDSLDAIDASLNGAHFVDLSYPPTEVPGCRSPSDPKPSGRLVYKRATDIFKSPQVFRDDIWPDDVRQGSLGDCWLMGALSACAEFPALIRKLFPDGTRHANGLYRVKLCLSGAWQIITVDDFFPCSGDGPVYSRAKHEELWVLLLEKAMAKACGNYGRLRGGLAAEGLLDLTGLPTYKFKFAAVVHKPLVESGALFDQLVYADTNRCVAVASTPGEDRFSENGAIPTTNSDGGLVPGHAYALIAARRVDGHRLIWLRNPWGAFEWTGAWSDGDARWTPEFKHKVAAAVGVDAADVIRSNDGSFWMGYADFVKNFAKFSVALQRSPRGKAWSEARCRGAVTVDNSAVTYALTLTKPAHVIVGVHQRDERTLGAPEAYAHVGFAVLRDDAYVAGAPPASDRQQFAPDLQSLEVWPAGEYVVCAYCLPHSLKKPKSNYFTDSWPKTYDQVAYRTTTMEIFARFNVSASGALSVGEGGEAAALLKACGLTKIADISLLMSHAKKRDGLSPSDLGAWLHAHPDYAKLLKALGYEPRGTNPPVCVGARGLAISVHADEPVTLRPITSSPAITALAEELPILKEGSVVPYDDLEVYATRSLSGASVLVKNTGPHRTKVTVDMAKSRNCRSHAGSLVNSATLGPGEARVLHHVCPAGRGAWGFAYELTWQVLG